MSAAEPIYLEAESQVSAGMFHPAAPGTTPGTAVLLLPPWGWDEVSSFRVRRAWAQRLSDAGHPTVRLSLPATGDSGGNPADRGLVSSWVTSVKSAAEWLRGQAGSGGAAAIGLGLGGLLGLDAVASGAVIEQFALWGVPASGRRFVRETKAFSNMQPWNQAAGRNGSESGLPAGAIEAGGFVLSAETISGLKAIAPEAAVSPNLRRVLLLDRDGVAIDPSLAESLGSLEIETRPGPGWATMTSHPETAVLPEQVAGEIEAWLGRGGLELALGPEPAPSEPAPASMRIDLPGSARGVRETALAFEQSWGSAFGVISEPDEPGAAGAAEICLVFLNAGAVRHTGPNRMWTEAARHWSARGVPAVRVDLEGIGEADGPASGSLAVRDFYHPRYLDQVRLVLDEVVARTGARRIALVGLCAGGYLAFRTAVEDERVEAAVLVNAGALRWSDDLIHQRAARSARRVFERQSWRRAFQGEFAPRRILALLRSLLARTFRFELGSARLNGSRSIPARIEADLEDLQSAGTQVCVAFSGGEPLQHELRVAGLDADDGRWPLFRHRQLPGSDHTLRPLQAQAAFHRLLEQELGPLVTGERPDLTQAADSSGVER